MKKSKRLILTHLCLGIILSISQAFAEGPKPQPPRLSTLKYSGRIIGPGNASYPVHSSWTQHKELMNGDMDIFDDIVRRIERVVCGDNLNKSVLLVGEASDTVKYIIARLASIVQSDKCPDKLWHVEIDAQKIISGHSYVGECEEYYHDNVYNPAKNKDAVLHFLNFDVIVGMCTSTNSATGIEALIADHMTKGELRVLAFMDRNAEKYVKSSKFSYVLNSFQERLLIDDVKIKNINKLIDKYIGIHGPHLVFNNDVREYFHRILHQYDPNGLEPGRSLKTIDALIGSNHSYYVIDNLKFESKHPYAANEEIMHELSFPELDDMQLVFKKFDTEKDQDELLVMTKSANILDTFSGQLGDFKTKFYPTNNLNLVFTSNDTMEGQGFKLSHIVGRKRIKAPENYTIRKEDVRRIIMERIEAPKWVIEEDYSIISDLRENLDYEVVGVEAGKNDLVRLAEIGFASGKMTEKPMASLLFVGPTGTGKSYIAKIVSRVMDMKLITIDMTNYQHPYSFDNFIETMSKNLMTNPYAFYLFEEIDKANVRVLDQLFFMLDEGIFFDKNQRELFARGAFIMMTTNASQDIIVREQDNPKLNDLVMKDLQNSFRHAFLNRFNAITIFKPFSNKEFYQLAKIMTRKIQEMANIQNNWDLSVEDAVIKHMSIKGRSKLFGARPMERVVENIINSGIGKFQIYVRRILENESISIVKHGAQDSNFFKITVGEDEFVYEARLDFHRTNPFSGSMFDHGYFYVTPRE